MTDIPTLTDESPMPIGSKYKGVPMGKVPAWHLDWWHDRLARQDSLWSNEQAVLTYIESNRKLIDKELEEAENS